MRKAEYDPLERALSVLNQVDQWMGTFFEGHRPGGAAEEEHWHPHTDVYETTEGVTILVELAGVEPSSVEVVFADGRLTVSGYREVGCAAGKFHQVEIENGRFARNLVIPMDIDEEQVHATSRHGLLEVFLPCRKGGPPRKISISEESEQPD